MDHDSLGRILVDVYIKVLAYLRPHQSLDEIQKLAANAAIIAMEYGKAHPYQTAFTVVSVGLTPLLGAGWMTAPLLKLIGFGPLGPIAGGMGSWYQATWLGGYIPAGSVFATLQSWAMTLA